MTAAEEEGPRDRPAADGPAPLEATPAAEEASAPPPLAPPPPTPPPPPAFQARWNQGQPVARLGTAAEDVQLLDTVCHSFSASWRDSFAPPDDQQGRLERERLAVAWARVLLDVRARDLRRRIARIALPPSALDRWDQVTGELTADLQAFGWRLADEEELGRFGARPGQAGRDAGWAERVEWHVPPAAAGSPAGPRWLRPPLVPAAGRGECAIGPAELAEPAPAPSGWHAPVLAVAWTAGAADAAGAASGPDRIRRDAAAPQALWAKAAEIDRRLAEAALRGIDSDLKQFIVEEYWEPLYALASRAGLMQPGSNAAGDAWFRDLARHMAAAQLIVRGPGQAETDKFREPSDGEPDARPAVLDAESGRVVCFGLIRRRAVAPPPAAPTAAIAVHPVGAGAESGSEGPGVVRRQTAAGPAKVAPGTDPAPPSAWHARVREVFAARGRLPNLRTAEEQRRYQQLMRVAGRIDLRQRDFIVEPADDAFKSAVAEEFWAPLYALADRCFGFSRRTGAGGPPAGEGAAWLARMQELLGMAQLHTVPAGPDSNADWFREPAADEPPGRPAVIDLQSQRVYSLGTRPALDRRGPAT